jgi:hypothetical protein
MQQESTLLTIAEIAVAFAGFSGIAAALRTRGEWHPFDLYRTSLMLLNTFAVVVLSLLPVSLHYFGVSGAALWRVSSSVMFLYPVLGSPLTIRFRPTGFPASAPERRLQPLFWGIILINILVQGANALTLGRFSLYFLGLFLGILLACIQFGAIVVFRPAE